MLKMSLKICLKFLEKLMPQLSMSIFVTFPTEMPLSDFFVFSKTFVTELVFVFDIDSILRYLPQILIFCISISVD